MGSGSTAAATTWHKPNGAAGYNDDNAASATRNGAAYVGRAASTGGYTAVTTSLGSGSAQFYSPTTSAAATRTDAANTSAAATTATELVCLTQAVQL